MASTVGNRPAQYRAKAQDARDRAATTLDEATRHRLLRDAEMWERMAAYEEQNPTIILPAYYPAKD